MLDQLDARQRLRLMRFICSFAWADLEVQPEERSLHRQAHGASRPPRGGASSRSRAGSKSRPSPEEVDPTAVPQAHRQIFVDSVTGVIEADGEINFEERSALGLFEMLVSGG